MIRLAIIGTSGRNEPKLSTKYMNYMKIKVLDYITNTLNVTTEDVILVSGGSAWADHVAVELYEGGEFGGLHLYLPAEFLLEEKKFIKTSEGNLLNYIHEDYDRRTNSDPFKSLYNVITNPYVVTVVKNGFLNRNKLVAENNDHLLAFTFKSIKIRSGTSHTWNRVKHLNKVHFQLEY